MIRDRRTPWCLQSYANGLGAVGQVGSSAPLDLCWTSAGPPLDPPPTAGSKPRWLSRDCRRAMLSSTPDHTITMLTPIMAFPADRSGMLMFVLFLLLLVSLECNITQYAMGYVGFRHDSKCLFVVFALQTVVVSSMNA